MAQLWRVTVGADGNRHDIEKLEEQFSPLIRSGEDGVFLNGSHPDTDRGVFEAFLLLSAETPHDARAKAEQWFEKTCKRFGLEADVASLEPEPADAEDKAVYVLVRLRDAARAKGMTLEEIAAKAGLSDEEKLQLHASWDLPISLVFRLADELNVSAAELVDPERVDQAFRDGERTERMNAERRSDPKWPQQELKARLLRKGEDGKTEA